MLDARARPFADHARRSSSRMPAARPRAARPGRAARRFRSDEPGGWQSRRAVGRAASRTAKTRRAALDARRPAARPRRLRRRGPARRAARPRRARDPRRARLSAAPVPLAARQQARRRVRRQPREPHALSARGVRRGARRVPGRTGRSGRASRRPTGCPGGWDIEQHGGASQALEGARLRGDPRLERRRLAAAEDPARPRLPGAVRAARQGGRSACRRSPSA